MDSALDGAYRSYEIVGRGKTDVDSYLKQVRSHVYNLIVRQLHDLESAKVQFSLWIKWYKEEIFTMDDEGNLRFEPIIVDKPFNSKMTGFFQGSDYYELIDGMFAYIKTQTEHPALPKSGFTIDHIMHMHVNFHQLMLTRGSSYIKLPAWIENKKAVINPKNKDEECFKWSVIIALHHKEISDHPERVEKLKPYVDKYNWKGLKFPMAIQDIGKFE